MKHRTGGRTDRPQPAARASRQPEQAPAGSAQPSQEERPEATRPLPVAAVESVRGARRRRLRLRRQPAWLATLGAVAIFGAALGWKVTPEPVDDSVASVEAVALKPGTYQAPTAPPSAKPTASATPTSSAGPATAVATATATAAGPDTSKPAQLRAPSAQAPRAPVAPPAPGGGRVPGGMSGVAAGSLTELRAWESFRGSPANVVLTFTARDSWQNLTRPWLGAGPEKFAGFNGTWAISQPFFPVGGGDLGSCANGAYNSHWAEFGRWLVDRGRADSIVRLAWEANGNWFPWSVKNNPAAWVPCFRQVVSAMRSTDPQVRIDWSINGGGGNAFDHYPGDAYVDIIGISTYDHWPASVDEASWNTSCNESGLCSVIQFARNHGKQFSVAEWGLVGKSDTGAGKAGQAGGDNPFYIQKMYDTFRANADVLAYETYFNNSDAGNVHSSLINPAEHPNGAARYASLW